VTVETNSFNKKNIVTEGCVGISTQQRPNTWINVFERTHQSATRHCDDIIDKNKKRVNSCVIKQPRF